MKKCYLFIVLLLTTGFSLLAQPGFTVYPNSLTSPNIRTGIKLDLTGNKWYSTSNRGIYKFDGTTWLSYDMAGSGIPSNNVSDLSFDAANTLWAGTVAGLAKFDGTAWTVFNMSNSGILNDTVNCVFTESSNVWVGTKQGLSKFDGTAWTNYTTATSGLGNNNVTALNVDTYGDVWVGTKTGLSVKTSSGWVTYNGNNSNFVNDQVSVIYIENTTTKWIGTKNSGLFKCENNLFTPLLSMGMETDMSFPNTVNTISKGPQGGVAFAGLKGLPGVAGFYEITPSQIYFYPCTSGYVCNFHVFDASTNKIWFIKTTGSGSANCIYAFDYSAFTGTVTVQKKGGVEFLDINQVKAGVLNRGDMHWDLANSMYEVPKNSGRRAIYASSLWIGGLDNAGTLHQAAMTYRQTGNDFWPGPLDTITATTDSATSAAYDKIWKLNRSEIDEFRTMYANGSVTAGTYTPAYNILNWPATGSGHYTRNMAPFVDVNGDGMYNPMDGDYPEIKGDQMCYWIFNDHANVHTETGAAPLGVEVHASAYAYNCDSLNDSLKAMNYTTFYNYEIYNRSSTGYHSAYISLWQDNDLGGYNDDYVGCNPSGNYSFSYNGDDTDEGAIGGILGYGYNPPMTSNVILNGPDAPSGDGLDNDNDGTIDEAGEKNLMTGVLNYNNSGNPVNGNPVGGADFYNYMQSKWRDNSHVVSGGDGTGAGTPTNFMFDGAPGAAGWSEVSEGNPFIDRRIVMNCGPFSIAPQQHVNYCFAVVYTRDDAGVYDVNHLYNKNKQDVDRIRQWYTVDNFPSCDALVSTGIKDVTPADNGIRIYPNPATDQLSIDYNSQSKEMTIEIYDVTGQLLKKEKSVSQAHTVINVNDLSDGLYIVKISDGKNRIAQRFIKQ